ncbi:helix-turn-helix domain-containing protein [Brevibacillus fulvus]|uniref:Transcriptional regulator with XRE-family HTH domain n=1 Tax=Brevibacillus fulvus TaxID=1125967 RepID=A0A938XXW6_9BACL|nr:helix-turn-helix transcriptional regulator [Brevibacillus fulvus]MBM7592222.1 transcriptional regulator with XRE-family HTH domain [Brevibacillus fulvus]
MIVDTYSLPLVLSQDIKESGRTQASIAEEIKISKPTLSKVLAGDKPISINLLDRLTESLQKEPGYYYELFLAELFRKDGIRPRRPKKLEKYVLHCLEKGLQKQADQAVSHMIEDGGYIPNIFEIAEELNRIGKIPQARSFYEIVIRNEKDRTAPHLAMAYFRRLMIVKKINLDLYEEAAIRLCEYLEYVPDEAILEAYYQVISAFRLKSKWDYVLKYGHELMRLAQKMERPDYIGDALIKLAIAARERGEYDLAIHYHDLCAQIEVGSYSLWAEGNKLITQIAAGQSDKIIDLYKYCLRNKEMCFDGIETLLESAVNYDKHEIISQFFDDFAEQIVFLKKNIANEPIYYRNYVSLKIAKATWYRKQNRSDWLNEAFKALEMAGAKQLKKQAIMAAVMILQFAERGSDEFQKAINILEKIEK